MTEPDVTLTDYGLAVECALFTYLLARRHGESKPLRPWFVLFFASGAAATLAGGTVHGFFLDPASLGAMILWPTAVIAVGLSALAAWGVGATIQFSRPVARGIVTGATVEFAAYAATILTVSPAFWIAVLNYLPAAAFLLATHARVYWRTRARPVLAGVTGLALTFVAAGIQQGRVAVHPVYFNHNALYHVIQAVALLMIFLGARWLVNATDA